MYKSIRLIINEPVAENAEIVSAFFGNLGFESFQEGSLHEAFINSISFNEEDSSLMVKQLFELNLIQSIGKFTDQKKINWNAEWESNFEPVYVPNLCYIRAHFHKPLEASEKLKEIVITPKMSFGTGHHATTYQMIEALGNMSLSNKSCLDMGTGTGILGIYAIMEGAHKILAIDNDDWCVTNTIENMEVNHISEEQMSVELGEELPVQMRNKFELVVANINRNVLLAQISSYARVLKPKGELLLSGFHPEDFQALHKECLKNEFKLINRTEKDTWVMLQYQYA